MKDRIRATSVIAGTAVLAGAIAAATAAAPKAAAVNPLRVSMYAANGAVEVIVTNTGNRIARVPKWQLPDGALDAKLFQVSRDGQPVAYEGPMIKRGLPTADDFALLRPGQSYRMTADLAGAYDMRQRGQYTVTLASPLQHASLSNDGGMLSTARGLPMLLQSAPLRVWHEGGTATVADAKAKPAASLVSGGVTYVNCSSSQVTGAGDAVTSARGYSENAKGYLNGGSTGPRYTTWFGAYTSSRYSTVRQHFVNIDAAIDQSGGQVKINCGCNQNYYAYVYPTRPYEIFVCRAFWSAPRTGTDSKAGTLIHEMSHFNVVAGTDDHVYGQSGARNLASTNPASAVDNADNHEYFAENTPYQN